MTIIGPDVSSNQASFDFGLAYRQGCRATYIKLGGDNIPRYVSGSYARRVDEARSAGLRVGHYWITGGHDPVAAAQFFVRNLRNVQPGDFFVLDNENLDDGNMYSDAEAQAWIRTVQQHVGGSPRRLFMYCSQSPLSSGTWAGTRSTGCQALVAWYGRAPLSFGGIGAWPDWQIGGHQYTSSANIGGWPRTDMNAFKDNAFDFAGVSADGATAIKKRTDTRVMDSYHFSDRSGRQLAPGEATRLKNAKGADQCVIVKAGLDYSFVAHLEATGTPGDRLELFLVWQNSKAGSKPSRSYTVLGVADEDGKIAIANPTDRAVNPKDAVYVQVAAPATNKGSFKITLLDSDAKLFSR